MKKVFIIILILISLIMFNGCKSNNNSDYGKKEAKKDTKDNTIQELLGEKYDFACKDIKNTDFYLTYNYIYMNNSIYNKGPLYSNNQNCMKISNVNYDRYVILNSSPADAIFIKNDKAYILAQHENQDAKLIEYEGMSEYKDIALEDKVVSISLESSLFNENNGTYNYKFYVLKSDGNVYLYETRNHKVIKNEIIYSSEEYGKIEYFYYSSNDSKSIENIILFSNKGLFTNEIIKTADCTKYADIECEKEFKINKEFDRVKDQIIFFSKDYIVDNEYNLYSNNFIEIEYIP